MSGLDRIRSLLDAGDLEALFIDHLGWDRPPSSAPVATSADDDLDALMVATKRGVGVWRVGAVPDGAARRRMDAAVSKHSRERLIVFTDGVEQLWMWPEQRPGGAGFKLYTHRYVAGTKNEGLVQRLEGARFSLEEEGTLTVLDVLARVRKQFNAEAVTKKFYKEFKQHHGELAGSIEGIPDAEHTHWYSSVLMNRLMFIYFMQKKGFLDDDRDYLRSRLGAVRAELGKDAFYGFYRRFLRSLFHDALGSHDPDYEDDVVERLIGDVPYVNGGIFAPHELEEAHDIDVPDAAFEAIFRFFDQFRWHLDETPTEEANEINPDVLGYIFEQYINQREQGAYYTKEDVTGYMVEATLGPATWLRLGFDTNLMRSLVTSDPDRYIRDGVTHGIDVDPSIHPVRSQDDALSDDADEQVGLPGETWREAFDRHEWYRALRSTLAAGGVDSVDDFVSLNLNVRLLLLDALQHLDSPGAVDEAFARMRSLTVLDPTCGSGAFLFAALDLLDDLYSSLTERMDEFGTRGGTTQMGAFLEGQPNKRYAVLSVAILSNLYGLDINPEAAEIARLRLFLKLVAQCRERSELKPLPDLDFNIRAGNLLVGVRSEDDVEQRLSADLLTLTRMAEIQQAAQSIGDLYSRFVDAQADSLGAGGVGPLKAALGRELSLQSGLLDQLLFETRHEKGALPDWLESAAPFHWLVAFPGVMASGGFDVVVGNPPYVGRKRVSSYRWVGYRTGDLPDICAPCVERSVSLVRPEGRFAMILPISTQFSNDFSELRRVISERFDATWVSTYSRNPSALFSAGLGVRSSIVIGASHRASGVRTTKLSRWVETYRPYLFGTLRYATLPPGLPDDFWPRTGSERLAEAIGRLHSSDRLATLAAGGRHAMGYRMTALYYISAFLEEPPSYDLAGRPIPQTKVGEVRFPSRPAAQAGLAIALSRLALFWWSSTGDDFDVTRAGLLGTPTPPMSEKLIGDLSQIGRELAAEMGEHLIYTKYAGKWMGNYDIKAVRSLTDQADRLLLEELGMGRFWGDLKLAYDWFLKATGERPGTLRESPFKATRG